MKRFQLYIYQRLDEFVEIAKKSVENIKKTSDGIVEVMNKIKDGRGSLLGKVNKMEKVGGISIKESQKIPQESKIDEVE